MAFFHAGAAFDTFGFVDGVCLTHRTGNRPNRADTRARGAAFALVGIH